MLKFMPLKRASRGRTKEEKDHQEQYNVQTVVKQFPKDKAQESYFKIKSS